MTKLKISEKKQKKNQTKIKSESKKNCNEW